MRTVFALMVAVVLVSACFSQQTASSQSNPSENPKQAKETREKKTKTPPAPVLLLKAAGVAKGSGTPNKDKVGKVTAKQVEDIAKQKMPDLNAASVETAIKSVRGTARSMGIEVIG